MKNLLLLTGLFGGSCVAVQAQTTIGKGTGLLSGNVAYRATTNEVTYPGTGSGGSTSQTTTFTFSTFALDLAIGGFVADNLALALQISHTVTGGSAKSSSGPNPSSPPSSTTLRVGPAVQYYNMLSDNFGLTGTFGAGYESDVLSRTQYGPSGPYYFTFRGNGFYAAVTPGIVYFPIPKFGLMASMGGLSYTRLTVKNDGQSGTNVPEETVSTLNAAFGFSQLQFGASYYFGRK